MKRNALLFALIATFTIVNYSTLFAQKQGQKRLDSLLAEYGRYRNQDSVKVNLINFIAFEFNTINPDKGIAFAQEGINLAKKINFRNGLANCLRSAGVCCWAKSDYYQALDYFFEAMKICEESGFKQGVASTTNNIGLVYLNTKEYKKALDYFNKALRIYSELKDSNGIAKNYQNVGNVFNKLGDYNKALEQYFKALEINERLGLKSGIATNLGNIGKIYQLQNNFQKAFDFIFRSLEINKELNRKRGIMYNLGDIGETFYLIAKEKISNKQSQSAINESLKYSIRYSSEAVTMANQINAYVELIDWYKNLGKANAGLKNWEDAYYYYNKSYTLKDSVFSIESQLNVKYLEIRQERELKDKEIKIQKLEIERQRIIQSFTIAALILISLLAFLLYARFRIKKRSNEMLERKNKLISEQNAEISLQKDKIDLSYNNVKMLSEIGQKITANLTAESITATVYDSVSKLMNSTIFGIGIYNQDLNRLEFTGGMELDEVLPFFYFELTDHNRLAVYCFNNQKEILISDYMNESIRYLTEVPLPKAGKNSESLLYMPLNYKNKKIGVITVQSFEKNAYNNYHMDILKNLSIYVAIALDNAEAYKHIEMQNTEIESKMKVVEQQSRDISEKNSQLVVLNESKDKYLNALKTELEHAANYVKSLIPDRINAGAIQTQWIYIPSLEIGGDSFGYHLIDETHFAIYLIDVSGHGIGAALHSVTVINNIKNQMLPNVDYYSPRDVLTKLNDLYQMKRHNNMFFTIWYGVLNMVTKELKYASAGHPGALYIEKNSKHYSLKTDNIFIGGTENYDFNDDSTLLDDESVLYVYSDGVYEIIMQDKSIWEQQNLDTYLIANNSNLEGKQFINLYQHVLDLRSAEHLDDDFSILKLKFDFKLNNK